MTCPLKRLGMVCPFETQWFMKKKTKRIVIYVREKNNFHSLTKFFCAIGFCSHCRCWLKNKGMRRNHEQGKKKKRIENSSVKGKVLYIMPHWYTTTLDIVSSPFYSLQNTATPTYNHIRCYAPHLNRFSGRARSQFDGRRIHWLQWFGKPKK